jgi:hypothetical protein
MTTRNIYSPPTRRSKSHKGASLFPRKTSSLQYQKNQAVSAMRQKDSDEKMRHKGRRNHETLTKALLGA